MGYYIKEIKCRFFFICLPWLIIAIISLIYKEILLYLIVKPCLTSLNKNYMYFVYTNLTEIISNYITISIYISTLSTFLLLIYHSFDFIKPGLYKKEIFLAKNYFIYSSFMFIISTALLYMYTIPLSWNFFLTFQNPILGFNFFFEAKLNDYLEFFMNTLVINLLLSQIFIFLVLWLNIQKRCVVNFKYHRKSIYVLLLLISTLITPPDIFSQLFVYTINLVIYECVVYYLIVINLKSF